MALDFFGMDTFNRYYQNCINNNSMQCCFSNVNNVTCGCDNVGSILKNISNDSIGKNAVAIDSIGKVIFNSYSCWSIKRKDLLTLKEGLCGRMI